MILCHLDLEPERFPVFLRDDFRKDPLAKAAALALPALAGQELVRNLVHGDSPQDFPGQHVGREKHRAGDHQLRQQGMHQHRNPLVG